MAKEKHEVKIGTNTGVKTQPSVSPPSFIVVNELEASSYYGTATAQPSGSPRTGSYAKDLSNINAAIQQRSDAFPDSFTFFGKNNKEHQGQIIKDSFIGKGAFGCVFNMDVQKKPDSKPLQRPKVSKVFCLSPNRFDRESQIKSIWHEYNLSSKTPHLGMKKPIFIDNRAILVMNKFDGMSLYDFLFNSWGKTLDIEFAKLIQIIEKILVSYKEQVVDCGLIHSDLTPANIILDLKDKVDVNIIDFGLGYGVNDKNKHARGCLNYLPLEIFVDSNKANDQQTDLYALGKIIALVVCAYLNSEYIEQLSHIMTNVPRDELHLSRCSSIIQFNQLFMSFDFGGDDELLDLKEIISGMISINRQDRTDINHFIAELRDTFKDLLESSPSCEAASSSSPT